MSELISVTFDDMILRVEEDGDGKTLVGRTVPWDKPTHVMRPIEGFEVFKRGALTRSFKESKKIIPLLAGHDEKNPIGKVVHSEPDNEGELTTFRLFNSRAAEEAAELVREGVWSSLSIGAYGVPARTKVKAQRDGTRLIERYEVRWDHVALLRTPAYEDAKVLALRGAAPGEIDPIAVARARNRLLKLKV